MNNNNKMRKISKVTINTVDGELWEFSDTDEGVRFIDALPGLVRVMYEDDSLQLFPTEAMLTYKVYTTEVEEQTPASLVVPVDATDMDETTKL